ncbi:RidA family protein [Roseibium sp. M-1]
MIEHIETTRRMSRIAEHNVVACLRGQVGDEETNASRTPYRLSGADALRERVRSVREPNPATIIRIAGMAKFTEMNEVWNACEPEGKAPADACGEARRDRAELRAEIN